MKKCYRYWLLITGCAQQTFAVQNKPAAVAPKEAITHHFYFVSGIGQKKTVNHKAKICGGAENVVKTREPTPTFVVVARFYYFVTPLEACVYCSQ